jgi:hypothetical protein
MNFKEFLLIESESNYKTEINDIEQIKELLNTHCKNADFKYPIVRGMRGKATGYIFEGKKGKRTSISPGSFHNLFVDENIKKKGTEYPLRGACIIGLSDTDKKSVDYIKVFGKDKYVIFPYDDVIIGVCDEYDILKTIFVDKIFPDMPFLNDLRRGWSNAKYGYDEDNVPTYTSIDQVIDDIYEMISKEKYHDDFYFGMFNKVLKNMTKAEMEKTFLKLFSIENMRFKFIKNADIKQYQRKEVWVSGKCVGIKLKVYEELLKQGFKIGQ